MISKLAYYLIVLPLSYLPLQILYCFTDFIYLLFISVFPYRRKVVRGNLTRSFPDKSMSEIIKIERKFYRHFTDLLAEGIKNLSISKKELSKRLKVENPEVLEKLFIQQKSVLFASGHYNNWEWLITYQNILFSHQAMGIGKPLTNQFWDEKINNKRSRFGMKVIHAQNFNQKINEEKNKPIAILVLGDQSPGDSRKSYWMNFLNQFTAMMFGTEQIAHEYNFPIVFYHMTKIKRGYYSIHLELVVDDPQLMKYGEITEILAKKLEKIIESKPEYWIWTHKRWKREIPEDLEELTASQKAKFNSKYFPSNNENA